MFSPSSTPSPHRPDHGQADQNHRQQPGRCCCLPLLSPAWQKLAERRNRTFRLRTRLWAFPLLKRQSPSFMGFLASFRSESTRVPQERGECDPGGLLGEREVAVSGDERQEGRRWTSKRWEMRGRRLSRGYLNRTESCRKQSCCRRGFYSRQKPNQEEEGG